MSAGLIDSAQTKKNPYYNSHLVRGLSQPLQVHSEAATGDILYWIGYRLPRLDPEKRYFGYINFSIYNTKDMLGVYGIIKILFSIRHCNKHLTYDKVIG